RLGVPRAGGPPVLGARRPQFAEVPGAEPRRPGGENGPPRRTAGTAQGPRRELAGPARLREERRRPAHAGAAADEQREDARGVRPLERTRAPARALWHARLGAARPFGPSA